MDMSSSRGQDLTDCPLPTAEGLAPRKLRWEVVVCDDAMPEPRGTARAGAGDCGPRGGGCSLFRLGRAVGRELLGVGGWALRSQFHRPRELGPHPPRAAMHCLSWREVAVGFCTQACSCEPRRAQASPVGSPLLGTLVVSARPMLGWGLPVLATSPRVQGAQPALRGCASVWVG